MRKNYQDLLSPLWFLPCPTLDSDKHFEIPLRLVSDGRGEYVRSRKDNTNVCII